MSLLLRAQLVEDRSRQREHEPDQGDDGQVGPAFASRHSPIWGTERSAALGSSGVHEPAIPTPVWGSGLVAGVRGIGICGRLLSTLGRVIRTHR